MIRRWWREWQWRRRAHEERDSLRYYLRQIQRVQMKSERLSIDPRGQWSPVQARHVLDIIQPEADKLGLFYRMIDVTQHNMTCKRVILVAYCVEHELAVPEGDVCRMCAGYRPLNERRNGRPLHEFDYR